MNEVLAETSFLYGGNAAFVEDLYARWAADPNSVEPSWRAFFASLHDSADEVKRAADEPAWTPARGRRAAARLAVGDRRPVAGGGGQAGRQDRRPRRPARQRRRGARAATLDSLRAIMMIRAYRMRGHLSGQPRSRWAWR